MYECCNLDWKTAGKYPWSQQRIIFCVVGRLPKVSRNILISWNNSIWHRVACVEVTNVLHTASHNFCVTASSWLTFHSGHIQNLEHVNRTERMHTQRVQSCLHFTCVDVQKPCIHEFMRRSNCHTRLMCTIMKCASVLPCASSSRETRSRPPSGTDDSRF